MDNFFGSVMMFITKEKKIEKEQNGRMELCGPQNTRKTGNEREREMFIFFSETIATKDGMEIYSSAAAATLFGLHKEKMIQRSKRNFLTIYYQQYLVRMQ